MARTDPEVKWSGASHFGKLACMLVEAVCHTSQHVLNGLGLEMTVEDASWAHVRAPLRPQHLAHGAIFALRVGREPFLDRLA